MKILILTVLLVLYEIYKDRDGIFLKTGKVSFQMLRKPMRSWHAGLVLTQSSLQKLNDYEAGQTKSPTKQDPATLRRNFFKSIAESLDPPKEEPKKELAEPIHPDCISIMYRLSGEIRRSRNNIHIEGFNNKTHVVLFSENQKAGRLLNMIVQKLNTGKKFEANYHRRGGRLESNILELCKILKCSDEFIAALKTADKDATISIQLYSDGSKEFNFPAFTGTILVVSAKR